MKRLIFIVIMIAITGFCFAEIIDLTPTKTEIKTNVVTKSNISFSISLDNLQINNVEKDGNVYQNIFVDEWNRTNEIGYPALPSTSKMVIVPKGFIPEFNITNLKTKILENIYPYPAQKPAFDSDVFATPPFTINDEYYKNGNIHPRDYISFSEVFEVRGVNFVYVSFNPVQFDPITKNLLIAENFDVEIQFGSGQFYDEKLRSKYFDAYFAGQSTNFSVLDPINYSINTENRETGAELLIYTVQEFSEAAEKLQQWKMERGYSSEIRYLEDIGTTANSIYTDLYIAYFTSDIPPAFAIMFGDVEFVPTNYVNNYSGGDDVGTDRAFYCMDGANDWHPDIAGGRISVDSADEAMMVVNKIVNYEKNPPSDESFYNKILCASYFQDDENDNYESRRFVKTSEEIRDFLLSENYDVERIYCTESNINPTNYNNGYYANGEPIPAELLRANGYEWNGNTLDVSNSINSGKLIVQHRDHGISRNSGGGFGGWGDPSFSTNNAMSLTNGELLPWVFSINCETGWFDGETDHMLNRSYECLCENFLRNPNGGAIGVIGATRVSYSGYNDFLALGILDSIWEEMLPTFSFGNSQGQMGLALLAGLSAMEQLWGGGNFARYEYDIFNVIGDPTLQIWRHFPEEITAEHDETITTDTELMIINSNINSGVATLVFNGEICGTTQFSSYEIPLVLDSVPAGAGEASLTIISRDFKPYQSVVNIVPPSGSFVISDSLNISDVNGNNDGEWDAGEELELTFNFTNCGLEDLTSVSVDLVFNEENISMSANEFTLENMNSGETSFFNVIATPNISLENETEIPIQVIVNNELATNIITYELTIVSLPKIFLNTDDIIVQTTSNNVLEYPLTIENIGASELHCTFENNSNQALDLTAIDNHVELPHIDAYDDLNEMTIMVWMKRMNETGCGYILDKGELSSTKSFFLGLIDDIRFLWKVTGNDGVSVQGLVNYDIPLYEWIHLAITVGNGKAKFYYQGEVIDEKDFTSTVLNTPDENIFVGQMSNGNFGFCGYLDELSFYNICLSAEEIQEKRFESAISIQEGMIGHYNFDTSTELDDLCGNNNGIANGEINFDVTGASINTWLGFSDNEITIPPYDSFLTSILFDGTGYPEDNYESSFVVLSNATNSDGEHINVSMDYLVGINAKTNKYSDINVRSYPNPFNPSTTIEFNCLEAGNVKTTIYNLKGQVVKNLLDSKLEVGLHKVIWNGQDMNNNPVSSGIYFYKVSKKGSFTATRKIILLK